MSDTIIDRCEAKGPRMTGQRRTIGAVLQESDDHPDVEEVYQRASEKDPKISIPTGYRTVRLFEEAGILERHEFGDGRARYEDAERDHHDVGPVAQHLVDDARRSAGAGLAADAGVDHAPAGMLAGDARGGQRHPALVRA